MSILTTRDKALSTAFIFPGQGSQKAGMLNEMAMQFALVKQTFDQASAAIDLDLWQIAQSGDGLDLTENTQPVLLTASIALWRLWFELSGLQPKVMAGHSLGEYSALVAAEAIGFADAVRLVHRRGQLMQQAVPAGEGAMAAILGLDNAEVIALCADVSQSSNQIVEAANFNTAGQVVVAGEALAVIELMDRAKANKAKAIKLPVSVPSHCGLMRGAAEQLANEIKKLTIELPKIDVIQNVNAEVVQSVDQIRENLIGQLYQPVQWQQTMDLMQQQNIRLIIECGSGNVLSNLAKRLTFIQHAMPLDGLSKIEHALHTVMTNEGKIA